MIFARLCIPIALFTAACSGTGQPEVTYTAYASGTAPSDITVGDWTVTVEG